MNTNQEHVPMGSKGTENSARKQELQVISTRAQDYFNKCSSDWLNGDTKELLTGNTNDDVAFLLKDAAREVPQALKQERILPKHAPFLLMAKLDAVEEREKLQDGGFYLTPETQHEAQKNAKSAEMLFAEGSKTLLRGNSVTPKVDKISFELRNIASNLAFNQGLSELGLESLNDSIVELSLKAGERAKDDPAGLTKDIQKIQRDIINLVGLCSVYERLADSKTTTEEKRSIEADSIKVIRTLSTLEQLEKQLSTKAQEKVALATAKAEEEAARAEEAKKMQELRDKIGGKESREKPQPWLDMRREAAYDQQVAEGAERAKRWGGDAEYLHDVLWFGMSQNDIGIKDRFAKALKKEDFKHIKGKVITCESASRVAGKEIKRFVFIVEDDKVYDKLVSVFGVEEGGSHGLFIPGSSFDYMPPWHETGALFAKNDPSTLDHEIRHSIDPNTSRFKERKDKDRILEELFAEYQDAILDGNNNWARLEKFLIQYYELHIRRGEITQKEYTDTVKSVIQKAKIFQTVYGDIETQRRIAQSKTVEDFMLMK